MTVTEVTWLFHVVEYSSPWSGARFSVFDYLLLKLASRCNLRREYCYWFRDGSVYQKPKVLTEAAEQALPQKLAGHIRDYSLSRFSILFHGGEPTLICKSRFIRLRESLEEVGRRTDCVIDLSMTTNGVLIDDDWAALFRVFNVVDRSDTPWDNAGLLCAADSRVRSDEASTRPFGGVQ